MRLHLILNLYLFYFGDANVWNYVNKILWYKFTRNATSWKSGLTYILFKASYGYMGIQNVRIFIYIDWKPIQIDSIFNAFFRVWNGTKLLWRVWYFLSWLKFNNPLPHKNPNLKINDIECYRRLLIGSRKCSAEN